MAMDKNCDQMATKGLLSSCQVCLCYCSPLASYCWLAVVGWLLLIGCCLRPELLTFYSLLIAISAHCRLLFICHLTLTAPYPLSITTGAAAHRVQQGVSVHNTSSVQDE